MCGIVACHHVPDTNAFMPTALRMSEKCRHRGPDCSGSYSSNNTILAHERLSIVGTSSGAQPLISQDESIALTVNGEIYNHILIRKSLPSTYIFKTKSDCEVIIPLYEKYGLDTPKHLDGMFSFVLYDKKKDCIVAARDPIGITSLYQGWSTKYPGAVFFASELKCLHEICDKIISFAPGHIYNSESDTTVRYFNPSWLESLSLPNIPVDYKLLRKALEKSVRKRLMAEVPFGVLLSGGLDSSLIASITQREIKRSIGNNSQLEPKKEVDESAILVGIDEDNNLTTQVSQTQLLSFSIGLENSPDIKAALQVAKFLNTNHHTFTFTIKEGLDALSTVIYHLESYDVTTIRASTPMFLLSKRIKDLGVKMVLSGEGSDEIFGETLQRVKNLHLSDCLRANKSTAAWGLEARVPFLDKEFLEVAMNIDPEEKQMKSGRIEKYILRKAFDTTDEPGEEPYLPDDILWRQKEQFSDGVGYGWIDALKDYSLKHITDEMMKNPKPEWGTDIPDTKEAYWYRLMFDEHFPQHCAPTVMRWRPTWSDVSDPSGRAIKIHNEKYV
ncbi:hypothetical protein EPUL_000289 [Erysiphe pulchra]|uniref:asparagine synthase (glutamine-hydrolyzing) n=1 Tax=Erysiphe pulchra TaxID=225359 RepID=A0A2S4Q1A6_9PEZI|nr:hypothetical protein EPUL_000289 [Erysiphe pulchra]